MFKKEIQSNSKNITRSSYTCWGCIKIRVRASLNSSPHGHEPWAAVVLGDWLN